MIKRLFFDEVYSQALKSDMNSNHGAIMIYRGKIIGKGYNTYNTYNNSNCKEKASLHAEISAINSALKKISINELKKCELVIIRVNKTGECINSMPCCNCKRAICNYNIKRVYYS